jgi:cytochrome oxidase Cu insertion factor (SCO1/SenC/PrrC family)
MLTKTFIYTLVVALILTSFLLTACGASASAPSSEPVSSPQGGSAKPEWDWFDIELTDVQTGETFTMNDYAGQVVLVETMAIWCPNCLFQANEVIKMHKMLDNPDDVISVSLDVDVNEDEAMLKEYTEEYGLDWHFAISPREVNRALGNLYTAQYLNPPLSPMLIIDRDGEVHHLEYGHKSAEVLLEYVQPFLAP